MHATVDLNNFLSINKRLKSNHRKDNDIIMGSVGRLNWAKGYDLLIKAISNIKDDYPNLRLKIVGDGPYKNMLEKMIEKYCLRDNIFILGELHYKEISKFLYSLDLYIHLQYLRGHHTLKSNGILSSF